MGVDTTNDPTITFAGMTFICSLKSAQLLNAGDKVWEFELEVPGLDFSDVAPIPEIIFSYGEHRFGFMRSLKVVYEGATKYLVLSLEEIINKEENDNE